MSHQALLTSVVGSHAAQIHGDRRIPTLRPKRDPFAESRAATAVHQHDAGPGAFLRGIEHGGRAVVGEDAAWLALEFLTRIQQRFERRLRVRPFKLWRHRELLQVPRHLLGQLRRARDFDSGEKAHAETEAEKGEKGGTNHAGRKTVAVRVILRPRCQS